MISLRKASTIEDFITAGNSQPIKHSDMFYKSTIENKSELIIYNYELIFIKYIHYIEKHIKKVSFTDVEFSRYKYRPKLLSMDLYKTPDLWSLLLYVNNMISTTDFTKKNIKVFDESIFDVIDEIMTLESSKIDTQEEQLINLKMDF